MKPRAKPLTWNHEGAIRCLSHAPVVGTDTWVLQRWRRMSDREVAAFALESGRAVTCECCRLKTAEARS